MAIESKMMCDKCGHMIFRGTGVVVAGNIYVADENGKDGRGGGLVGSNLDQSENGMDVVINDSHFHRDCLFDILPSWEIKR